MHPAELVDAAVRRPVVVYGSLPPDGRDLDLLARPDEAAAIRAVLGEAGFVRDGRSWQRPPDPSVDLRTPADWGLPTDEVQAVVELGRPVPGYAHLLRPGPPHVLLLLARRVAGGDGTLDDRLRARLDEALRDDPQAWRAAERHAEAWGATRALQVLRSAHDGRAAGRAARAAARTERLVHEGSPRAAAAARAWRSTLRPAPRGAVVAICGLDGAGKSSQAAALAASLEQLGQPAVTQWTRLSYDPALDRLARPVKRLVRVVKRRPAPLPADVDASRVATPEQRARQSSRTMTAVWALVVAVSNGLAQRRSTREHLRAGRVVVCDRWTLDSAVHLRYRYGENRRFAAQVALIRLLSPRPVATVFLDIPAATAYARKDDHYDERQLARQERLYAEEHSRHRALRLDGTRPREELAVEILREARDGLRRRAGRRW